MKRNENFLSEIVSSFFSGILTAWEINMNNMIEKKSKEAIRGVLVAFSFLVGIVFALNGLGLFIGEYLGTGSWAGYAIVGAVLMMGAYIFKK